MSGAFEGITLHCYNRIRSTRCKPSLAPTEARVCNHPSGQVAQLVERSPEKAGVGGSIPSLATIISDTRKVSCAQG